MDCKEDEENSYGKEEDYSFGEDEEYSYEDEDDADALRLENGSEMNHALDAIIDSEIDNVNERFGLNSASFCQGTESERIRHGPSFRGFIYFFFSTESIQDLSRIWGFNPKNPIIIRFCYFSAADDALISRKDFSVAVYQGDEPSKHTKYEAGADSSESMEDVESSTSMENGSLSSVVIIKDDAEESDAEELHCNRPQVDVIKAISHVPFRIGEQIKKITEEYLVRNVNGSHFGGTGFLALSATASRKKCERCTFLNETDCLRCAMCEGSSFTSVQEDGFLVQLYDYLMGKIPQLHRFCINCDQIHLPGLAQPAWPSVCQRELCQWSLTEMGIGRISTDDLMLYAEVVDLLLAITRAAAASPRSNQILSPFPLVFVEKEQKQEKGLDPKKPDYIKMKEVAEKLPSMQQIAASENENQLLEICNQGGDMIYGLLQWILTSCPARILSLPRGHRLKSMGTPYQFLVQSASPEREEIFAKAKSIHGSTFAFHGSPIENWHRILREGIKNVSGTPLQLNGAAYGPGVYLSPNASTSLGYSKVQGGTSVPSQSGDLSKNIFVSDKQVHIMALCEIIENGIKRNGTVWVVSNDEHIIVRFLFIFVPSLHGFAEALNAANRCSTENTPFQNEILSFCQFIVDEGKY